MKKLLIVLITLLSLFSFTNVFAEKNEEVVNLSIGIEGTGYDYFVELPDSINNLLASEKPTMKVNTTFENAIVYNSSGKIVNSSINDGVVSFKVTASGTYIVHDGKVENEVTDGSANFVQGSASEPLVIEFGKGLSISKDNFGKLFIDGDEVGADKFKYWSGSIVIELSKDYLNTLSTGSHIVSLLLTGGEFEDKLLSTIVVVNEKASKKATSYTTVKTCVD